jgi:hypothetical protein
MTITISDITNKNLVDSLLEKMDTFDTNLAELFISQDHTTKNCYDFSI